MSFEQLDQEKNSRERKEKKKKIDEKQQFYLEKQVLRETSHLLHDLALVISQEFWIDISEVKNLISWGTVDDLGSLKSHISSSEKINLSDLQSAISWAKDTIAAVSKEKRESLKASLEKSDYNPELHRYYATEKIIPDKILNRALYPTGITDHAIWVWLGILDSTEAIILFTYGLWKWILLTPYHIFLLVTGKANYPGFSKI